MARIEPIAWEELPEESRAMMESGTATGMYSTTVPLQIIAYSSMAMKGLHDQYEATFRKGVLEPRLVELLRLHSAQAAAFGVAQGRGDRLRTRRRGPANGGVARCGPIPFLGVRRCGPQRREREAHMITHGVGGRDLRCIGHDAEIERVAIAAQGDVQQH